MTPLTPVPPSNVPAAAAGAVSRSWRSYMTPLTPVPPSDAPAAAAGAVSRSWKCRPAACSSAPSRRSSPCSPPTSASEVPTARSVCASAAPAAAAAAGAAAAAAISDLFSGTAFEESSLTSLYVFLRQLAWQERRRAGFGCRRRRWCRHSRGRRYAGGTAASSAPLGITECTLTCFSHWP